MLLNIRQLMDDAKCYDLAFFGFAHNIRRPGKALLASLLTLLLAPCNPG